MNAGELLRFATELRRGNKAYVSNAFFTLPQLEELLSKPGVTVRQTDDLAVICEEDTDLLRVYLYARSGEALRDLRKLLPETEKPVITDVVGREPAVGRIAEQLIPAGFEPYSTFVRMVCTAPVLPRADGEERVEPATAGDAAEIDRMLRAEFDPLFSHFPSEQELAQAAEKGEITVIRADGTLAGVAFFEKVSAAYCVLRYFMVKKQYRGRNIGGALLYHTMAHGENGTVYMLWIGTYNKTQELYKRTGFTYDGLCDRILKLGGNKNGKDL